MDKNKREDIDILKLKKKKRSATEKKKELYTTKGSYKI